MQGLGTVPIKEEGEYFFISEEAERAYYAKIDRWMKKYAPRYVKQYIQHLQFKIVKLTVDR